LKRPPALRSRIEAWLAAHQPARIEAPHVVQLLADVAPVTESALRRALRQLAYPMAPLVEGVRQDTLENLARTLMKLADEYKTHPQPARQCVLAARQHAEWALRRHPHDEAKQEVMLWLRTWLENPDVFSVWCRLRCQALERALG
jgi:hypothetical protein